MELIQVIKSLKPAERLKALIFVALITSATALITSYLKTDDCSQISKQYESALNSYSNTMRITNDCINESNRKTGELVVLSKILDSISKTKGLEYYPELITRNSRTDNFIVERKPASIKDQSSGGSVMVDTIMVSAKVMIDPKDTVKITKREKSVTSKRVSVNITEKQKKLIDSANKILEKYKKMD
jgi:hypothetical protein